MNKLQQFIQSVPCGFLTTKDMPALLELDRLFPVLVRCGGCRFTCGAQYVEHLIKCVEAGGDYVRDVSFPVGSLERAASWRPDPLGVTLYRTGNLKAAGLVGNEPDRRKSIPVHFDESQCGGVFDGYGVVSDADPGL